VESVYQTSPLGAKGGYLLPEQNTMTRNEQLIALHAEGYTLAEVGRELGITRERVRQILNTKGTFNRNGNVVKYPMLRDHGWLSEHADWAIKDLVKMTGASQTTINLAFHTLSIPRNAPPPTSPPRRTHCPRGHLIVGHNVYGYQCRICFNETRRLTRTPKGARRGRRLEDSDYYRDRPDLKIANIWKENGTMELTKGRHWIISASYLQWLQDNGHADMLGQFAALLQKRDVYLAKRRGLTRYHMMDDTALLRHREKLETQLQNISHVAVERGIQ